MPGRITSRRAVSGRSRLAEPVLLATPAIGRRTEASDTMEAWERFLTGDGSVTVPSRNFVVASWLRSRQLGINPTGRSAPIVAAGGAMELLRARNAELLAASAGVFAEVGEMFSGSRSMMLLTNPEGVILDVVGDPHTLGEGEDIHLKPGGDWREDTVGTNGIGTALATGRPAQVHAAEHFCEGIKAWTCAASPVFEPGTGAMLGVIDISGPPATYQRNNLSLAVSTARQIEMVLAERAMNERMRLLEICLDRVSAADVAGMVAIDRRGRLVHSTGRVPSMVAIGQRVPGLDDGCAVEAWADRLPEGLRPEWFSPVRFDGRAIGAVLVVPGHGRAGVVREAPAAVSDSAFDRIIGQSTVMLDAVARARKLVGKQVPVLIHGETGVGKELFARAVHGEVSERRPFVVFNCGAIAKDLLAGELFGHVRGAFTGATSEGRPGRFELANGGTLCLDEIGELPLELQPFLLRALEEGVIYRLGDGHPRPVNVRLLSLTNRDLLAEVAAGRFRQDLYYRISVTTVRPPPLRERSGDVAALIEHFNKTLSLRHGVPMRRFGPEVMRLVEAYGWPGNVRELRNMVESQLLMAERPDVDVGELAMETAPAAASNMAAAAGTSLEMAEHAAIQQAIRECNGNLAAAARLLGVSRSTLYRKMDSYHF
ncbi:sigma-54-dependent Fis family transcriptional regulator [Lichenicoccus sp.]|uniref:sigma-54-dependent Fis family transcriptional regulator n=1 Tax=Lichenicoccus sp. TaxID=2781899 RepID=UPI003D1140D3